jgi:selenium metabolism protein YedF
MNTIDCRNMACPAPVVTAKKALEERGELRILVDDGAARENVTRFARNRGCQVCDERVEGGWALTIVAGAEAPQQAPTGAGRVLLVTTDRLGEGPEELGRLLMKNFIHTLLETHPLPDRILFLNSGVFLTTEGSEVLEALEKLGGMGVEILSCGLCLDFFQRKEKLRAGAVTNMLAIVESALSAGQTIRL